MQVPFDQVIPYPVAPTAVDALWPHIEPMIRRAVNHEPMLARLECAEDVRKKLVSGRYGLWLVLKAGEIKAAIVLSTREHSRGRVVCAEYAGGEGLAEWIEPLIEEVTEKARAVDTRALMVTGREQWQGILEKLGFKRVYSVWMKEI